MSNTVSVHNAQVSENTSLAKESFAAAMDALKPMAPAHRRLIGERLLALGQADRHDLVDACFGDKEISWWPRDQYGEWPVLEDDADWPLAVGYDGSAGVELVLLEEDGEQLASWNGRVAEDLILLGRFAGRHRNGE
jgi:hypothetical protein